MALGLLALAVACLAVGGFHPDLPTWVPGLCSALAITAAILAALVSFGAITVTT
ncbi:hypothetical protein [Amycolatopsis sp. NPDC001319]|uniref:hypothetical protein n=1 Tax=unclassified Amycolatopsis TaxID=2618356 RepID=UPI0036BE25A5